MMSLKYNLDTFPYEEYGIKTSAEICDEYGIVLDNCPKCGGEARFAPRLSGASVWCVNGCFNNVDGRLAWDSPVEAAKAWNEYADKMRKERDFEEKNDTRSKRGC